MFSPLTGVKPVDVADLLGHLWRYHMTGRRSNVMFHLPESQRWAAPIPTPPERKTPLEQVEPYWRTWQEFQNDILALAERLQREGRTARLRVQFPIGHAWRSP